jgi:hypothetical protein
LGQFDSLFDFPISVFLFAISSIEAIGLMACSREVLPASFRCSGGLLIDAKQATIAARLADNAD